MNAEDLEKRIVESGSVTVRLIRRAIENPARRVLVAGFLQALSDDLWAGAISAALQTPQSADGQTYRMVDETIASALRGGGHLKTVLALYDQLPRETVALQETALEVASQVVAAVEEQGIAEKDPAGYLLLRNNYVGRLLQMENAVKAEEEAGKTLEFANDPRHAALPNIAAERASAFEFRAIALRETNRPSEALGAMDAAREIYEGLSREQPDKFRASLAICLNNYISLFTSLHRYEDAARCGRSAAALFRELLPENQFTVGRFAKEGLKGWMEDVRPNLATCLVALSSALEKTEKHEEALAAATEAVSILLRLTDDFPEFSPLLAQAQDNHAMALEGLNKYAEALESVSAATKLFRELERLRPGMYTYYLAHSLRRRSLVLAKLGRWTESVEPCGESVELFKVVRSGRPEAFVQEFDGTLSQMETILRELGRNDEADLYMNERGQHNMPAEPSDPIPQRGAA